MDRSDIAEAITVAGLKKAGYSVEVWDESCAGFYIDPDIIANKNGHRTVVLVNASDSFFASQKKIWRNIEEPFEAHVALGRDTICVSIAFISPAAKNALFAVSSQLFDDQFLLCDRMDDWQSLLRLINDNDQWAFDSKQALAQQLLAGWGRPEIASCVDEIASFFLGDSPARSNLQPLWKLEAARVQAVVSESSDLHYEPGHFHRRGIEVSALLGRDNLQIWSDHGLAAGSVVTFDPDKLSAAEFASAVSAAEALTIHGLCSPVVPSITGTITVAEVDESLVHAFGSMGVEGIRSALDAMLESHPPLRNYIEEATDYEAALAMATVFLDSVKAGRGVLTDGLVQCSKSLRYRDVDSIRNWMFDLLLYASGKRQTEVQRHCDIGRLTNVATGQQQLTNRQAAQIVGCCWDSVDKGESADGLAKKLMRERLYSLRTHSYANPLYSTVRAMLEQSVGALPNYTIDGFPDRNSVSVSSWHNRGHGAAGTIKVQFIVTDVIRSRELVIRVGSCHDGNVGNKRKEVAAKARVLSYHWSQDSHPERATNRWLVLVLDGDWLGPQEDPLRHVRMMHEAGWQYVLSPPTLGRLDEIVGAFVADSPGRP